MFVFMMITPYISIAYPGISLEKLLGIKKWYKPGFLLNLNSVILTKEGKRNNKNITIIFVSFY